MRYTRVYQWLRADERRRRILLVLNQPLTTRQISRKTGIPADTCSYLIARSVEMGMLFCLNSRARTSRLYWLTSRGRRCRRRLCLEFRIKGEEFPGPDVDWALLGWVSFRHRSAVLRMLTEPMQPSEIRRRIRQRLSHVKISANNTRDIIRLFEKKGIVRRVYVPRKAHPRYELTDKGISLQRLLMTAESPL